MVASEDDLARLGFPGAQGRGERADIRSCERRRRAAANASGHPGGVTDRGVVRLREQPVQRGGRQPRQPQSIHPRPVSPGGLNVATTLTWREWQQTHPAEWVLSRDTAVTRATTGGTRTLATTTRTPTRSCSTARPTQGLRRWPG